MAVCANCKKIFSDDFIFCPNCGKKREDKYKCSCGATLSPWMKYCGKCGKITQIGVNRLREEGQAEEFERLAAEKRSQSVEEVQIMFNPNNYIDKGDYIELVHPVGNIRMIEKFCSVELMTWNDAMQYAKNLRKGGFSDWRLPTKEELLEIYKIKVICGINRSNSGVFWSSSTIAYNTNIAWYMNFNLGLVDNFNKSNNLYVRCVR